MKVTICRDEKTAKSEDGKIYEINGIVIKKDNRDVFYAMDEKFTKAILANNTVHQCDVLASGKINIL